MQNGDLNWIIRGKIIAFAGPHHQREITPEGYYTLTPSDYIPYFKRKNVGMVIRLNKKCYNEDEFKNADINHYHKYYLDGSCPSIEVLQKILSAFESVPHNWAFAVHCKAGLGRTGTCIGAYMMKHYKFTAAEVIGWMRICRPGMVIGPQQHFLQDLEQKMWYEGDLMRMQINDSRSLSLVCNGPDANNDTLEVFKRQSGQNLYTRQKDFDSSRKNGISMEKIPRTNPLQYLHTQGQNSKTQVELLNNSLRKIGQGESLLIRRTQQQLRSHSYIEKNSGENGSSKNLS